LLDEGVVHPVDDRVAVDAREPDGVRLALSIKDDRPAGRDRRGALGHRRTGRAEPVDQHRQRNRWVGDQPVVGLDGDRGGRGDDGQEPAQATGLGGQAAVVAVGHDQLAPTGEGGQFGRRVPRNRPDGVGPADVVGVGHRGRPGRLDRGPQDLVELGVGLQQQHR
jgi:hypothetical protein